jgi:hypothetical protein
MSTKRTIKAKEFIRDIRIGMADPDLIEKYGVTPKEFKRVLRYLVDAGLITQQELEESQRLSSSQIIRAFVDSNEDAMAV